MNYFIFRPPRPPTKPTRVKRSASNNVSRQSSSSFPSPDSSSKDSGILCNTPEMATLQMSSDVDFEERVQRWERRKTVALTPNSLLQPINEKRPTPKPTTSDSQNAVQELFDSQGIDPRLLSEIHASSSEAHEDSDVVNFNTLFKITLSTCLGIRLYVNYGRAQKCRNKG